MNNALTQKQRIQHYIDQKAQNSQLVTCPPNPRLNEGELRLFHTRPELLKIIQEIPRLRPDAMKALAKMAELVLRRDGDMVV